MSTLGSPLVVFSDLALCDGHHHEVRLITDGTHAYAYDLAGGHTQPLISRDGASPTVTVSCRVLDTLTDEECHGEATFRLTDDQWTTDPEALDNLSTYGQAMDQ
jgi:hypothetical protein